MDNGSGPPARMHRNIRKYGRETTVSVGVALYASLEQLRP